MTVDKASKEELIRTHINIISSLYIKENKWLNEREKQFMIHLVLMRIDGYDFKNNDATTEIKSRMNFSKKQDVWTYRGKLKKKGWLVQTKDDVILPAMFDRFTKHVPKNINYKFNVKHVETTDRERDS